MHFSHCVFSFTAKTPGSALFNKSNIIFIFTPVIFLCGQLNLFMYCELLPRGRSDFKTKKKPEYYSHKIRVRNMKHMNLNLSICVPADGLFGQCRSSKQDQVQYHVTVPVLKRMQEVLKQLMLQGEIINTRFIGVGYEAQHTH